MSDSLPLYRQITASPAFLEKLGSIESAELQERELTDGISDAGLQEQLPGYMTAMHSRIPKAEAHTATP